MLTDAALKNMKPKEKSYKVTDRDGMYVDVSTGGTISFRLDCRLNGRRETVTFGKYAPSGLSLARAWEKCLDAKRQITGGLSPAIEKQREKRRITEAKSFGEFGEKWMTAARWLTAPVRCGVGYSNGSFCWRGAIGFSPRSRRATCGPTA